MNLIFNLSHLKITISTLGLANLATKRNCHINFKRLLFDLLFSIPPSREMHVKADTTSFNR